RIPCRVCSRIAGNFKLQYSPEGEATLEITPSAPHVSASLNANVRTDKNDLIVFIFPPFQTIYGSIQGHLLPYAIRYLHPSSDLCHLITLSAWYKTDCGIVTPRAFAVFKLITSSNFFCCSTIGLQISFIMHGLFTFDCAA